MPEIDNFALLSSIGRLRFAAGWSQDQFAKHLGVDRQSVSKWERGVTRPSRQNMYKLIKLAAQIAPDLRSDLNTAFLPVEHDEQAWIEVDVAFARRFSSTSNMSPLSLSEIARRSSVSLSTVRRLMNNASNGRVLLRTVERLSAALDVSSDWLVHGPGDIPVHMAVDGYYNLLVSGKSGAWDGGYYSLSSERVLEFTSDNILKQYGNPVTTSSLIRLSSLPTLFAYESSVAKPPKIGRIVDIHAGRGNFEIFYEIYNEPTLLGHEELEQRREEFGISPWELNRTHWAVKAADWPV